jgi:hypothetical protein
MGFRPRNKKSSSSKRKSSKEKKQNAMESYVKVNDRIAEFYEKYPEGVLHTIRTEVEGGVVFQTYVMRHKEDIEQYATLGVAKANGFSFLPDESREDMKVEEYSETVSVGRALAKFGLSIEKSIASEEEMDQFKRVHKGEDVDEDEDLEDDDEIEDSEDSEEDDEQEDSEEDEVKLPKLRTARKFNKTSRFAKNT